MKVTQKKEISLVFLLVNVISLAVCERLESGSRLEEMEASIARTQRRIQENKLRLEEYQWRHQAEMESHQEFMDGLMDISSVPKVLHRISRSSTRDLRALTKGIKHKSDVALQEAHKEVEREQELKTLLENRWWRAKIQHRNSKHELEAMDRATKHQAQTMATKIEATLEEVHSLRRLRHKIDENTERILTHSKVGRKEGIVSRWWRRLYFLFHMTNLKATPDNLVPHAGTMSQAPDPDTNDGYDIVSLEKHKGQLGDPVDLTEVEAPTQEADPVDDTASDTEIESVIETKVPSEEAKSGDDTGSKFETETVFPINLAPEESVGGSEGMGTASQDLKGSRQKKAFMWLVCVGLSFLAFKVHSREWAKMRKTAHSGV